MSDRGPDSAGLAIYGKPTARKTKIMVQSQAPETDFKMLKKFLLSKKSLPFDLKIHSTHAVIKLDIKNKELVTGLIKNTFPNLQKISFNSDLLKQSIKLKVTTKSIRTIEHHGGIDNFILSIQKSKLSGKLLKLHKTLKKSKKRFNENK